MDITALACSGNRVRLSAPQGFANADVITPDLPQKPVILRCSGCALIRSAWIRIFAEPGRSWRTPRPLLSFSSPLEFRQLRVWSGAVRTGRTTGHTAMHGEDSRDAVIELACCPFVRCSPLRSNGKAGVCIVSGSQHLRGLIRSMRTQTDQRPAPGRSLFRHRWRTLAESGPILVSSGSFTHQRT